ncbi:MAG: type IV pilus assembly protein PilM [bacterium]|nr:type IV pilus assembly protein PilM [bacterium]
MLSNTFSRFFPTSSFLETPSFGLDISDESIRYVELLKTRYGIKLGKYGEKKIPKGVVESGKIKDEKKVEEILNILKKENNIKSVRVSIPEEQIYIFKIYIAKQDLKNIREGIDLVLEEHIPIPAEEVNFDYDVISEDPESLEVQVVAASKDIIENYLALFKSCNIMVQSFELEAQAISRAVVKYGDMDTYMIVDFGEKRTGIFILSRGVIMFTSTLDVSGDMLNNMIMKNFKITFDEAEKMKQKYGLQRNIGNQEIFSVILNSVSVLRDEIVKHFLYWNTHKDEKNKVNPIINKIIICGGGANLIGISDYFAVSLKTKVEIANVWTNIIKEKEVYIPDINFKQSLSYASALGLALGDFNHD